MLRAEIFLSLLFSGILLATAQGCLWEGTWDTTFGQMIIEQNGNTVTGTYTSSGGQIQGTVFDNGNVLVGTWYESDRASPNNAGDFQLTMDDNCYSFSGNWRYGGSGDWDGEWTGHRI